MSSTSIPGHLPVATTSDLLRSNRSITVAREGNQLTGAVWRRTEARSTVPPFDLIGSTLLPYGLQADTDASGSVPRMRTVLSLIATTCDTVVRIFGSELTGPTIGGAPGAPVGCQSWNHVDLVFEIVSARVPSRFQRSS